MFLNQDILKISQIINKYNATALYIQGLTKKQKHKDYQFLHLNENAYI